MRFFVAAVVVEALTGLALLAAPVLVGRLLLGVELDAGGAAAGRLGGIALICLALACWPDAGAPGRMARRALLLLQPAMALCLALIALTGGLAGVLLWPAVAYHTAAGIILARSG